MHVPSLSLSLSLSFDSDLPRSASSAVKRVLWHSLSITWRGIRRRFIPALIIRRVRPCAWTLCECQLGRLFFVPLTAFVSTCFIASPSLFLLPLPLCAIEINRGRHYAKAATSNATGPCICVWVTMNECRMQHKNEVCSQWGHLDW